MHPANMVKLLDPANFASHPTAYIAAGIGELLWLYAYYIIIRDGFRLKTYCIPMGAIFGNIAWEFFLGVYCPLTGDSQGGVSLCTNAGTVEVWIWRLWFLFDCAIVVSLFLYGKRRQVLPDVKKHFYLIVVGGLALGWLGVHAFFHTARDVNGDLSAYVLNFIMSLLFLNMAFLRRDSHGLQYSVGWAKMLGTAGISMSFLLHPTKTIEALPSPDLMIFLIISVFILDALYVWLLHSRRRAPSGAG